MTFFDTFLIVHPVVCILVSISGITQQACLMEVDRKGMAGVGLVTLRIAYGEAESGDRLSLFIHHFISFLFSGFFIFTALLAALIAWIF